MPVLDDWDSSIDLGSLITADDFFTSTSPVIPGISKANDENLFDISAFQNEDLEFDLINYISDNREIHSLDSLLDPFESLVYSNNDIDTLNNKADKLNSSVILLHDCMWSGTCSQEQCAHKSTTLNTKTTPCLSDDEHSLIIKTEPDSPTELLTCFPTSVFKTKVTSQKTSPSRPETPQSLSECDEDSDFDSNKQLPLDKLVKPHEVTGQHFIKRSLWQDESSSDKSTLTNEQLNDETNAIKDYPTQFSFMHLTDHDYDMKPSLISHQVKKNVPNSEELGVVTPSDSGADSDDESEVESVPVESESEESYHSDAQSSTDTDEEEEIDVVSVGSKVANDDGLIVTAAAQLLRQPQNKEVMYVSKLSTMNSRLPRPRNRGRPPKKQPRLITTFRQTANGHVVLRKHEDEQLLSASRAVSRRLKGEEEQQTTAPVLLTTKKSSVNILYPQLSGNRRRSRKSIKNNVRSTNRMINCGPKRKRTISADEDYTYKPPTARYKVTSSSSNQTSYKNSTISTVEITRLSPKKCRYTGENYEKRSQHNNMERKRRVDLRNSFDDLKNLVPSLCGMSRAPKVVILKDAANYCYQLTSRNKTLQEQLLELRLHNNRLRANLGKLRKK